MKCLQVVLFILLFEGIACCQVVNLGEQTRLGDQFILKDFMDTILKAGAIPMDEFDKLMMVKK